MADSAGAVAVSPTPGLQTLLRIRAFRVLYAAEAQSVAGDQLARVALAVLVFDRTSSAVATALTYAATFLPAVLGGVLLGGMGDRFARRTVLVGCDVIRAGLFVLMAAVDLPLGPLIVLVCLAVLIGPVFSAAQVSYLAAELTGEQFRSATGARMVTGQLAQVAGFVVGGGVVEALHPRGALLIDAVTYAASAALVATLRPSANATARSDSAGAAGAAVGSDRAGAAGAPGARRELRALWAHPTVRGQVALLALAGFFVVPEGLAVPFGERAGASTASIGLLFAAVPLGTAIGTVLVVRAVPSRLRVRASQVMAAACGLPLLVTLGRVPWPVAFVCWVVSGALAAYQIEVTTDLIRGVPDHLRSRFVGVLSAVLLGAQGVGLALFGAVAQAMAAGTAIAVAGATGALTAVLAISITRRANRHAGWPTTSGVDD
ncbi:MFS transporter [uncultured Jatrophihabitans sp.]|uniref:MFS transporter n=1 Tax=uncultured Jatrophihabitans sp. TaxID=1610747 RepID=UPI0035C9F10B